MAIAPGLMQQRPRGLFGATSRVPQQPMPAMTATAQPQKKGFDWQKALGVLGDSLSIAGGGQASYVPMMQQQRLRRDAQDYAEQQYQRRRGDENQDWMARQEWERENPTPRAPHYWETNDGSLGMIGPDGQPQIVFKDPTKKIQWMQVDNGDGTKQLIPYGPDGPLGQSATPPITAPQQGSPQRPKGKLTPYNGGQTATPSGTFR